MQELICSCYDIVPEQDDQQLYQDHHKDEGRHQHPDAPPNLHAMLVTIEAFIVKSQELLDEQHLAAPKNSANLPATNTNNNNNNIVTLDLTIDENDYDSYFKKCGIHFQKKIAIPNEDKVETNDTVIVRPSNFAPKTLDLTQSNRKRKYTNSKLINYQLSDVGVNSQLNEIIEECEYDSDIGKFTCNNYDSMNLDSENSSFTSTSTANNEDHQLINDLNTPNTLSQSKWNRSDPILNINKNENDNIKDKIVMKRIEFFENNNSLGNDNVVTVATVDSNRVDKIENSLIPNYEKVVVIPDVNQLSTILCLMAFVFSVLILYIYPLPN